MKTGKEKNPARLLKKHELFETIMVVCSFLENKFLTEFQIIIFMNHVF